MLTYSPYEPLGLSHLWEVAQVRSVEGKEDGTDVTYLLFVPTS